MKTRLKIFTTILSVLAGCAFLPTMQAQLPPEIPGNPDGCYPAFTTAEGCNALHQLFGGIGNTAVGWYANFLAGDASFNTSVGAGTLALDSGIGSGANTALGTAAMILNLTGDLNVAVGTNALVFNDDGFFNNAVGAFAGYNNASGFGNNAFGESALFSNILGAENTAIGDVALASNDSDAAGLANNNTAVGGAALLNNVDGSENTALGTGAGPNVVDGFNNTYVGDFVGTLSSDESDTIRIGDLSNGNGAGSLQCYIGGIFNNFQPAVGSVVEVTIDLSNDHLGWDIPPSAKGVTPPAQRGVPSRRSAPGMPTRPATLNGKVGQVEKFEATVAQQQRQIEALTSAVIKQAAQIQKQDAQIQKQDAQIQKVSAQLEVNKPAPQVVVNTP
jgi:hypothetical protein